MNTPTFEGLVIAGGRSSRMGADKSHLRVGQQTWLARQVQILMDAGCRRVRVGTSKELGPAISGYDLLYDRSPDMGPLEPIAHGLVTMMESHLVVLAVDLPKMTVGFVRELMSRCDETRGCVPRVARRWEPLAAVYCHRLRSMAIDHLGTKQLAIRDLVDSGIREGLLFAWDVDADGVTNLLNVNSPEDIPNEVSPSGTEKSPPTELLPN